MKLKLIKFGKPDETYRLLIEKFHERTSGSLTLMVEILKPPKVGESFVKPESVFWVALDEKGAHLTSVQFAQFLDNKRKDPLIKQMVFFVGPPDGLPPQVKSKSDYTLQLSAMTFPSDIAWLLLAEQLYRAVSIINGHPYHRV